VDTGDATGGDPLKHAVEVGSGAGFEAIGFAETHPDFRVTGIDLSTVSIREANNLLKVYPPDVQSRVRFVGGNALKIDPASVDAPVPLAYNLFPSGQIDEVVTLGGSTARFVEAGGKIYVLTEFSADKVQVELTNEITDILNKRGLEIESPVQVKSFTGSDLEAGLWDLEIPLVSMQSDRYANTLFIFKVGRAR
jgi:hypothetical protein